MRALPFAIALAWSAVLALGACGKHAPDPVPAVPAAPLDAATLPGADAQADVPPQPARVPAGCELNLSGRYRARADVSWRYLVEDDGHRLVARREQSGSSVDSPSMVLVRTAEGFVGEVRGAARTHGGRDCAVGFPTEIVACRAGALVLRSVERLSIDERCEPAAAPGEPVETILLRD